MAAKVSTARDEAVYVEKTTKANQYWREAVPLLAALAPTPEAQAFKAKDVGHRSKRLRGWPSGKPFTLTETEMADLEQQEQEFMTELKALPKITPAQLQAEIDSLPEDGPHGVVPNYGRP